jgi:hypothetical protein
MAEIRTFLQMCSVLSLLIAATALLAGLAILAVCFSIFAGGLYCFPHAFEKGRDFGVRETVYALLAPAAVRAGAGGPDRAAPPDQTEVPSRKPGPEWAPERPLLIAGDLSLTLGYRPGAVPEEIRVTLGEMGHMLVGGAPRSGKSVLVRAILYQALLANFEGPAGGGAVWVAGIDLTGITLNPALFEGLPVLFEKIATTRDEADGLLDRIEAEAAFREERFRTVPTLPEKLAEYIQATGNPLPYVIIVVEEFGALSLLMGKEWQARFTSLVWRVAKYGFHFICLSQDLTKATVGMARDAFMTRIWFRELPAPTRQMLGFKDAAAVSLNVAGRGWLKLADHEGEFQGLFVPKQNLIEVVNLLKERKEANGRL